MSWFHRNRMRVLVAGLFLSSFLLFQARVTGPHEQTWFDRALVFISAPVQKAVVWLLDGTVGLWTDYVWLVGVERDNERLRYRIEELERRLARQAEYEAENLRLRELVSMAGRLPGQRLVAARVVGLGTSPAAQVIRIDAGSDDGLEVGDAVMSGAGLVGRVSGVVGDYAQVQLVIDGRSAVDVVVQRTRSRGIVRGQGVDELCMLDHLVRTADVKKGDQVVTSGIGGLYPAGLTVGTVISVTSPQVGVFRKAEIEPAVDFEVLEEVLVVLKQDPEEVGP